MNSTRLENIAPAKSIVINQKVYEKRRNGQDVTVLSLGEAYFSIPDFGFNELDHNVGYHYSDSQGMPELRDRIEEYYKYNNNISVSKDNVIISAGSKALTLNYMLGILNSNDEVLLHEPAWLSYEDQAKLCDATVTYIPYKEEISSFEKYFTDKTKLIVINNPNNPSGLIYKHEELRRLIELANINGIYVLVDEAYSDFISDSFKSAAEWINEFDNLCVINSMSKNFGMSGWRIGYAIANDKIIKSLTVLNQHTITCAPTILQMYFSKYMKEIYDICKPQLRELIKKRKKVESLFHKYDIPYLEGSATFYFFVDISKSKYNGDDLSVILMDEHSIATVPGSAYGKTTGKFLRVSIGTESFDKIDNALKIISEYLKNE
ncbi:pyridoxal phosphate-dependent aminotransferase [Aliivibrio fischeri]|uniref:pyridoxal phosphate-dependent aminotransferase n=1 Tax=Aliivibrio fischeri TaxID=668 RepID=UPI001F35BFE3|nr:pyridoxal phosphate-dependent aminotransferase [Aliivibrio fischeri]MCE7578003.1 pyridoxal phosphate-dependent aminotransferase [Aliivibrio fischeri]MCE7590391.1 pyridoxal phosphate-dependent aminotransferase [Aliivibrio fischeri]